MRASEGASAKALRSVSSWDNQVKDLNTNYHCKQVVLKLFGLRNPLLYKNYWRVQRASVYAEYSYQNKLLEIKTFKTIIQFLIL